MERIRQSIYLSRTGLNSIEFEHEVLKVPLRVGEETSFEMFIINQGEPTHVHFSLGEEIKDKVMILQDKVYVIDEEKIAAIVKLPKSYAGAVAELGTGEISVSAGYGATKDSFSVEIVEAKEKEKGKEKRKEKERKESEGERELEEVVRKEKKEFKVSPGERVFLMRLAVSAVAAIFFFVLLFFIIPFLSNSPFYFASALIASFLFIFIVIYNF
ncbi:hypothetical protein ES705_15896 [subsurface metagenome]|nr:hypothetical protein [Methanosarcinales archaeon]